MLIRDAKVTDVEHLVRFINMAADDLPLYFWQQSEGAGEAAWAYGRARAARETGGFSYRNAWLAEVDGKVAAGLLGYPADAVPSPIDPDTPALLVPILQLEALAPGSWYLNMLATYAPFRGQGLGSALLSHAETVARAAGHTSISLLAEDSHTQALRLYAAKGYSEIARRPVVKEDWQVDANEWVLFAKSIA